MPRFIIYAYDYDDITVVSIYIRDEDDTAAPLFIFITGASFHDIILNT